MATFSMGGSTVSAHHPLITASAACATDGAFTINYTSTAWEGFGDDPSRTNQNVIIYANVNGGGDQQVDSGAFVSPNFSFSGQFSVPASTTSLVVSAFTAAAWGNGSAGGQTATTTVNLPTDCTPTTTTTTSTTTTTTEPPTTTSTTTTTTTTTTTSTTTTTTLPPGDDGCTPGYWKNHTNRWQGFTTGQSVESVFDVPDAFGLDDTTLLQALSLQGGSTNAGAARILLRAGTAALLNAAHDGVDYPRTTAAVIAEVNTALASNDRATILALASSLDADNNLGCTLD